MLVLYYYYLSLLYRVIYNYIAEKAAFLGYIILQLFSDYNICYIHVISHDNVLYFYISTFRNMCAVPSMSVSCSSLMSRFPVMLPTYFLNDFQMVPVSPIHTYIIFVFTFNTRCNSIVCYHYIIVVVVFTIIIVNHH